MNADNNDTNNGNIGNRGKFNDRLKKMRIDRLKRRKGMILGDEENVVKQSGRNVLKVILAIPSIVYDNVFADSNKRERFNEESINLTYNNDVDNVNENIIINNDVQRRIKVSEIKKIDVSLLKKQHQLHLKNVKIINDKSNKDTNDDAVNIDKRQKHGVEKSSKIVSIRENLEKVDVKEFKIVKLQKEIIDLIKKRLIKNINELEILQSELYVLNELKVGDVYLKDCQEDIKEIKKLLSKVKSLKEKYDNLKDNVDFEYMLHYGDDFLIDKILELKDLCSSDDVRYTVENYKILDEYKFLYLKIDKLEEDTVKYEEYKNKKVEELKKRDIDFEKLKNEVYDIDREKERYDSFVLKQELFLKELYEKISRIDSYEKVSYKLKGFNQLLGNSFKYLGLLLVNPLKGLVPGITMQTVVTKNLIHNLYNNLEWKENRRMVYETIDYNDEINRIINNLDTTALLVDSTLEDIVKLKSKYINEFSKYEDSFSEYRDTIKKINKMENAVLCSKIKIEMMKQRTKEKEKENNNKLKMVKKLNSG